MKNYPQSLAIAGVWGYIGRKFLDAALRRRISIFVHDPGGVPPDVDPTAVTPVADPEEFYRLPVEMFHLAMHPLHRSKALEILLARRDDPPIAILNEKPMAAPDDPRHCEQLVDAAGQAAALMLFDFPELFDPLTDRILDHLAGFRDVRINDIYVRRSKDREARDNPRNYKLMVPIQYQESVHCLAFVLYLLARLRGSTAAVFDRGLTISGAAQPYVPPNPEMYPYVVDGRCDYRLSLGSIRVDGQTDFKSGAGAVKQRVILGSGDGRPFHIEVDYQEGRKRLNINGVDQTGDPAANSYDHVLRTFTRWRRSCSREDLMGGVYPHPAFARVTYQLSSILWRACRQHQPIRLASLDEVLAFDAGFRAAVPTFDRYA
jgi:hypothetical protein